MSVLGRNRFEGVDGNFVVRESIISFLLKLTHIFLHMYIKLSFNDSHQILCKNILSFSL